MQQINRQQACSMRQSATYKNLRKARTRTLIQLGGLIEKSGLLDVFEIEQGQDLQKDPDAFEGVSGLMGALLALYETLQEEDVATQKKLWALHGKEALKGFQNRV